MTRRDYRRYSSLMIVGFGCTMGNPAFDGDGSAGPVVDASTLGLPPMEGTTHPHETPSDGTTLAIDGDGGVNTSGGSTTFEPPQTSSSSGEETAAPLVMLLTHDGETNTPLDSTLRLALEEYGADVTALDDQVATAEDASLYDLVVISETVGRHYVDNEFEDVSTPVIVLEDGIWKDMHMADEGETESGTEIEISIPGHPLAGSLTGVVTFIEDEDTARLRVVRPPLEATVIAVMPTGGNEQSPFFAYLAGTEMRGGFEAPGCRVGIGIETNPGSFEHFGNLGEAGVSLFVAAVQWCLDDKP